MFTSHYILKGSKANKKVTFVLQAAKRIKVILTHTKAVTDTPALLD